MEFNEQRARPRKIREQGKGGTQGYKGNMCLPRVQRLGGGGVPEAKSASLGPWAWGEVYGYMVTDA